MATKSGSVVAGRQGQKNTLTEEKDSVKYLEMIDASLEEMALLRKSINDSQVRTAQTAAETRAILAQLDQLLPSRIDFR